MSMKASETAIRAFFETLNTGDLEALRPLVNRATWKPMVKNLTSAESYSGDAIIDDFLRPVRGIFRPGDPKVAIDVLVADENAVAVETRGTGKLADGRNYENRYAWFFELNAGRIVEIHEYLDSLYVSGLAR